jgi:hypothetical protein
MGNKTRLHLESVTITKLIPIAEYHSPFLQQIGAYIPCVLTINFN